MIEEILKAYLLSLTDKDQIALFATIRTVEANCAEITPYAQEFLKIGAEEINADVVTMSALTAYACLDRTRLSEFIEQKQFGEEVCGILSGILKIPEFNEEKLKTQNENHIKLLVTLSGDVRAIIILLAEHLLKIRHLKDISDPESYKIATEVQYLYSPVAHRIGLYKIKTEMEETCLKFFEYDTYRSIADKLQIKKEERDEYIKAFIEPLKKKFEKSGLKVSIKGRPKSISSIRQKMKKQNIDVDGIYDLFAIRVIIDSEPENEKTDCWKVYSLITEEYKPNPFRLRDWISVPKSSGYESLHTTVIGPEGRWVEVQIRTERMDEVAEKGLAAHWKYKNGTDGQAGGNIFSKIREANFVGKKGVVQRRNLYFYPGRRFEKNAQGRHRFGLCVFNSLAGRQQMQRCARQRKICFVETETSKRRHGKSLDGKQSETRRRVDQHCQQYPCQKPHTPHYRG